MVRKILCAVAFELSARTLVEWAVALATAYDAEVRLFHVLRHCDRESPDVEERLLNRLFMLARHLPGRPRVSAAVTTGDAAEEILRHAELVDADIIAVGADVHPGPRRVVLRITTDAACPVLVVPLIDGVRPHKGRHAISHIACAVDFLPASTAALDCAVSLARPMRATLTAIHVVDYDAAGHQCPQRLHTAVNDASAGIERVAQVIATGQPCSEIVRIVRDCSADLVVIGANQCQMPLDSCGSTAGSLIDCAVAPALIVPARAVPTPPRSRSVLWSA